MKKTKRNKILNIVFIVVIVFLIIPQTRNVFLVWIHKGLSYVNQSTLIEKEDRKTITYSNMSWKLKSDADNSSINFIDTKGKVVFMNYWATWCPPCIAEMPSIQQLYDDYQDKVVFLLITNDDFETVEKFKTKKEYDFEIFNPLNNAPSELAIKTIPRTFIINKKGEIVVDESGALNWNSDIVRSQLDNLLAE